MNRNTLTDCILNYHPRLTFLRYSPCQKSILLRTPSEAVHLTHGRSNDETIDVQFGWGLCGFVSSCLNPSQIPTRHIGAIRPGSTSPHSGYLDPGGPAQCNPSATVFQPSPVFPQHVLMTLRSTMDLDLLKGPGANPPGTVNA